MEEKKEIIGTESTVVETVDGKSAQENTQICSNCGNELHGEKFCPNCGTSVDKPVEKKTKKPLKKKIVVPIIVVVILALCGIGGYIVYNNVIVPGNKYEDAMNKIEDERYYEAVSILKEIENYKDAKEKISEAYYLEGVHYEKISEYDKAIEAFDNAGNYQDAISRKEFIEEKAKKEQELNELKSKLKRAYDGRSSSRTTLASDGLSISVDSKNQYDYDGLIDIASILGILGMPDSLLTEMSGTNALMGRQTQTYNGIEVSWSYHPDNGLDAIFKIVQ